jgi:hypothetical protein
VGPVEVRVIGADGASGEARIAAEDVRRLLPADERLSIITELPSGHWTARPGERRILLSIGAPGLRALTRMLRAGWRQRRPEVVVVDEGLGSYGTWRTRRDAYARQSGQRLWPLARAVAVATGSRLLTEVHWSLYERGAQGWRVNEIVADEFRRRVGGPPADPSAAVYLAQPWPDLGVMTEAEYAAHLASVREACDRSGLGLVVRPHPSESARRYAGFRVTRSRGPAEFDREVIDAPVLIGTQSTALLNLVAVHGCAAVRVVAPGLEELERALAPRQRSLLGAFLPPPVSPQQVAQAVADVARHAG